MVSLPCCMHPVTESALGPGDRVKRGKKRQADSSPPHVPFKPQFSGSEGVPLSFKCFPGFHCYCCHWVSTSYEACPGTRLYKEKKDKKGISVLKSPPSLLLRPRRQGCSWRPFFPCPLHSPRIHAASETRPADIRAKSKQEDYHQIFISQILVSSPSLPATTSF